jgi:hypothetical protein
MFLGAFVRKNLLQPSLIFKSKAGGEHLKGALLQSYSKSAY